MRGDHHVVRVNGRALRLEGGADAAVDSSRCGVEIEALDLSRQGVEPFMVLAAPFAPVWLCSASIYVILQ
jgi:hypothetical protein